MELPVSGKRRGRRRVIRSRLSIGETRISLYSRRFGLGREVDGARDYQASV